MSLLGEPAAKASHGTRRTQEPRKGQGKRNIPDHPLEAANAGQTTAATLAPDATGPLQAHPVAAQSLRIHSEMQKARQALTRRRAK